MSIVLDSRTLEVPGVRSISYLEDPRRVPPITDHNPRRATIRGLVVHTSSGTANGVMPGSGRGGQAFTLARYQANTDREVSWDWTIDLDGTLLWQNDPLRQYSWHAGSVSGVTLGGEIAQQPGSTKLWQAQVDTFVALMDTLTRELGIQRQIPWHNGAPDRRVLRRLRGDASGNGRKGADLWGIYGHRNQTTNRGAGDPGDAVFQALHAAGYEGLDFEGEADKALWRTRQRALRVAETGLPDAATVAALKVHGHPSGCWVSRPTDTLVGRVLASPGAVTVGALVVAGLVAGGIAWAAS